MGQHEVEQMRASAAFIQSKIGERPRTGIILGTGLSGLASAIENAVRIPYQEIPNFPVSTVQSHKGELIFGEIAGHHVVCMAGRFHYYEGYSMREVTFPVRVMKLLGIEHLIVSNAAGGVSQKVTEGDVAVLVDHISLFPDNPLRGKNLDEFGPRFPDLVDAYDKAMIATAMATANHHGIDLKKAVYAGVPGPNLETRAEFGYFKAIGADLVGMSTIPEVIVARHMSLRVMALSVVTNEGWRESRVEASVDDVIKMASSREPVMIEIVRGVLQSLNP